jgi:hypothetical protein
VARGDEYDYGERIALIWNGFALALLVGVLIWILAVAA